MVKTKSKKMLMIVLLVSILLIVIVSIKLCENQKVILDIKTDLEDTKLNYDIILPINLIKFDGYVVASESVGSRVCSVFHFILKVMK